MLANGTIKTIEDNDDIYISLTALCDYFAQSTVNMRKEIETAPEDSKKYASGLLDMMSTIADEVIQLGKFEAQRRLIDTPDDLLKMVKNNPFGKE